MRQQALAALAVLAFLNGCLAAGQVGPDGYREAVCAVTDRLAGVDAQLAVALQAVASDDPERLSVVAAGMEREVDEARVALERAPAWTPGSALTNELGVAVSAFELAADLFAAGARQGNGPLIDRALAAAQEADAAFGRAGEASEQMRERIGWDPC
jgi:hypothetical protein